MILVTGGTGLVGSHLLYHLLEKEDKIRAIYRTEEKREHVKKIFSFYTDDVEPLFAKIIWIQADITETPSLEAVFKGITEVYHCAALVSFDSQDYQKMREINIEGTANIVNFSIDAKVQKLCFVSSIATIGDTISINSIKSATTIPQKITEENEWSDSDIHSGYAISKYGAEMEVWRGSQEGLEVVIVNPGVILGSGFWQEGSGKLFTQINNGFSFYTEGITGFVGVQDVVKAMILLMESGNSNVKNERFILVSENKSFKEILVLIADNLHKKRPSIKVHKFLSAFFWRFAWFISMLTKKKPLLTKNTARASHAISFYNSSKIQEKINFKFTEIATEITNISKNFSA